MNSDAQRGFTLVETAVSVCIFALVAVALATASLAAARHLAPDPVEQAVRDQTAAELHIAVAVAKYQGTHLVPASVATTVPLPNASPLPVTLALSTSSANDGTTVTITTTWSQDGATRTVSQSVLVASPQPLPSSTVLVPGAFAAPTGAP